MTILATVLSMVAFTLLIPLLIFIGVDVFFESFDEFPNSTGSLDTLTDRVLTSEDDPRIMDQTDKDLYHDVMLRKLKTQAKYAEYGYYKYSDRLDGGWDDTGWEGPWGRVTDYQFL